MPTEPRTPRPLDEADARELAERWHAVLPHQEAMGAALVEVGEVAADLLREQRRPHHLRRPGAQITNRNMPWPQRLIGCSLPSASR